MTCNVYDSARVGDESVIPPCMSDLLDVVICVGRVTDDDDVVDVGEVNSDHEDIGGDDDLATILFLHEFSCLEVVVWPVQGIIHL